MSRYQRTMARTAQQRAAAARAVAAQNAQVASAQAQYYRTQAHIAVSEAETRHVDGLPKTCAYCHQANPPGSLQCGHCGGATFLPPPPPPGWGPPPPPPQSAWSRTWRAYRRLDTKLQVAIASAAVILFVVLVAIGSTNKPTAPTNTATVDPASAASVAPTASTPVTAPTSHPLRPGPVVVTITGTSQAQSVTISYDSNQQTWNDVALPATYHVGEPDAAGVQVLAEADGSSTGPLSCSLALGGDNSVVTDQGTGPDATAVCDSLSSTPSALAPAVAIVPPGTAPLTPAGGGNSDSTGIDMPHLPNPNLPGRGPGINVGVHGVHGHL